MLSTYTDSDCKRLCVSIVHQLTLYHASHHLTQRDIASFIGLHPSNMSRVATGVILPSLPKFLSLVALYNDPSMIAKRRDLCLKNVLDDFIKQA